MLHDNTQISCVWSTHLHNNSNHASQGGKTAFQKHGRVEAFQKHLKNKKDWREITPHVLENWRISWWIRWSLCMLNLCHLNTGHWQWCNKNKIYSPPDPYPAISPLIVMHVSRFDVPSLIKSQPHFLHEETLQPANAPTGHYISFFFLFPNGNHRLPDQNEKSMVTRSCCAEDTSVYQSKSLIWETCTWIQPLLWTDTF